MVSSTGHARFFYVLQAERERRVIIAVDAGVGLVLEIIQPEENVLDMGEQRDREVIGIQMFADGPDVGHKTLDLADHLRRLKAQRFRPCILHIYPRPSLVEEETLGAGVAGSLPLASSLAFSLVLAMARAPVAARPQAARAAPRPTGAAHAHSAAKMTPSSPSLGKRFLINHAFLDVLGQALAHRLRARDCSLWKSLGRSLCNSSLASRMNVHASLAVGVPGIEPRCGPGIVITIAEDIHQLGRHLVFIVAVIAGRAILQVLVADLEVFQDPLAALLRGPTPRLAGRIVCPAALLLEGALLDVEETAARKRVGQLHVAARSSLKLGATNGDCSTARAETPTVTHTHTS